ncbi:large subunit ribosomal protein L28e [Vigna unguiculata]|uniref:Large subunit ribosomal protein L28e n=1 Tax=Vigna unguiculata TaxID=3917 RepID=A0A4D6MR29_VIGUN|nr:large subunit ribosomal protein L28e [Vigna unguiculata]
MATVPGQLVWEIVKKNNSFLVKQFGRGTQSIEFSRESNNLYNLNSFKFSGLSNKKTVTIQPVGKDLSVLLATTKTKKQNKPASLLHKSVMKKEFRRMAKAVENQVADNYYRPDLKNAALARLSAVNRSLKVAKSGVKKRNRQAVKVSAAMSVKKSVSLNGGNAIANLKGQKYSKRRRFDRPFSSVELSIEPGKQLKDMDSNKLKADIKKWAKAVVAYARQISGSFGKSRG